MYSPECPSRSRSWAYIIVAISVMILVLSLMGYVLIRNPALPLSSSQANSVTFQTVWEVVCSCCGCCVKNNQGSCRTRIHIHNMHICNECTLLILLIRELLWLTLYINYSIIICTFFDACACSTAEQYQLLVNGNIPPSASSSPLSSTNKSNNSTYTNYISQLFSRRLRKNTRRKHNRTYYSSSSQILKIFVSFAQILVYLNSGLRVCALCQHSACGMCVCVCVWTCVCVCGGCALAVSDV